MALEPGAYDDPALSPDGRQIALTVRDATGARRLWVHDIARGTLGKRTFDGPGDNLPIWSPDGTLLTFTRAPGINNVRPLMRVRADGTGAEETLVADAQLPGTKVATSWTADGRLVAIMSRLDIVVRDAEGMLHPTLTTGAMELEARFVPSGQWFSYLSNGTGRGLRAVVSPWERQVADLHRGRRTSDVGPERPGTLLQERQPDDGGGCGAGHRVQRFLVLTTAEGEKEPATTWPITVVLNYAQALKR